MMQWKYIQRLYTSDANAMIVGIFGLAMLVRYLLNLKVPLFFDALFIVFEISLGIFGMHRFKHVEAGLKKEELLQQRQASRVRVLHDLDAFSKNKHVVMYIKKYNTMALWIDSMYKMAADPKTSITQYDVDKFNDMNVHYLALIYGWANIRLMDNKGSFELEQNVASAQTWMRQKKYTDESLTPTELQKVQSIKNEYSDSVTRANRKVLRTLMLETTLNAIPDKMAELYHMLLASPYGDEISARIGAAIEDLQKQEDMEHLLDMELEEMSASPGSSAPKKQAAAI